MLGARAAAGAGSCAGARGSARFGVVVVCGCSLVTVPAGGPAPVCGSGCGRWWALSWHVVCRVSKGGAAGGWGGVRSRRGAASFLCWWAVVSHVAGWGRGVRCGMVVLGCVVAFPLEGGGHRVQVWWGGWSLVAGPLAVWGSPVRSLGRPSGVFQHVGRARVLVAWGLGSPGAGCVGLECRNQEGVVVWCFRVSARRSLGAVVQGALCMGDARAIALAGSAGRWVAASSAFCGPGAAPAGDELRCVAGVYRFQGGGGAMCPGVGWVGGRLLACSGCRGLTVGGSSAVSPCCVLWWSLVGWLKGVLRVYRIHGGTIVCWRAATGGAVGCWDGACVGVVCVIGGGASCVFLGGSSWRSVVVVLGGWSWAWRFLGGCGTCGVGLAGGGARVCVGLRVCLLLPPRFLALPAPCPSLFACLFCFVFFWGGGGWGAAFLVLGVGVGACRCWCWCGRGRCGKRGWDGCCALGTLCVCRAPGFRFLGCRSGGADGGWLAAVVPWRLRGWSRLLGSAWVAWPGAGVRVGVFMAWAYWVVGSVGVAGLCGWWDGASWVSGMCAPKAWWVGLGHCGRCKGWRRCC